MTDQALTVELENNTTEMRRLNDIIAELSGLVGFSKKCRFEVDLITEEVFTNILNHAVKGSGPDARIRFTFTCKGDQLEIQVEDEGPPFNPESVGSADVTSGIEDRQIGGLGLHLIRNFADDIQYVRTGRKNRLKIVKKLQKDTEESGGRHGNK